MASVSSGFRFADRSLLGYFESACYRICYHLSVRHLLRHDDSERHRSSRRERQSGSEKNEFDDLLELREDLVRFRLLRASARRGFFASSDAEMPVDCFIGSRLLRASTTARRINSAEGSWSGIETATQTECRACVRRVFCNIRSATNTVPRRTWGRVKSVSANAREIALGLKKCTSGCPVRSRMVSARRLAINCVMTPRAGQALRG